MPAVRAGPSDLVKDEFPFKALTRKSPWLRVNGRWLAPSRRCRATNMVIKREITGTIRILARGPTEIDAVSPDERAVPKIKPWGLLWLVEEERTRIPYLRARRSVEHVGWHATISSMRAARLTIGASSGPRVSRPAPREYLPLVALPIQRGRLRILALHRRKHAASACLREGSESKDKFRRTAEIEGVAVTLKQSIGSGSGRPESWPTHIASGLRGWPSGRDARH